MLPIHTSWQLWIWYGGLQKWEMLGFYETFTAALGAYDTVCRNGPTPQDSKIVKIEHL